jgi:autotransporter family porin
MKTNPINKLSALIGVICGLTLPNPKKRNPMKTTRSKLKLLLSVLCASALNFSAFADNYSVPDGETITQTGSSYNDSDSTLPALNVSGEGTTYNGTNITLSTTTSANSADPIPGAGIGAYVTDRAVLSLTGGTITTTGSSVSGIYLGSSSGTLNNVNIQAGGPYGYGAAASGTSTLTLTGGTIRTNGVYGNGINLDNSSITVNNVNIHISGSYGRGINISNGSVGTVDNVNIQTEEYYGYGAAASGTSTLTLTGGTIRTNNTYGNGINLNNGSSGTLNNVNIQTGGTYGRGINISNGSVGTVDNVNIQTGGLNGYGAAASGTSTLILTNSDITTTGNGAYGLYFNTGGSGTVTLNGNTLSSTGTNSYSIHATTSSTVTLTGSNGSVITGNVRSLSNSRVDLTLTGEGTELHGNFNQSGDSVINLSLGTGALLAGGGELDSLTLANGVTIGYTGTTITVTDNIEINGLITIDFSELTATGNYDILNWSAASGTVDAANFSYSGAGVQGNFNVVGDQLVFTANAVPEPSTYFLLGAGLGLLLLTARYRRQAGTDA